MGRRPDISGKVRGRRMSRRPRIPGMRKRTLFILPEIHDDDPPELKNALAIRNACTTEGRCPDCGAVGELNPDADYPGIFHYTFRHEPWCGALTDEAA
jgi:hypothetical protein